MEQWRDIEGFDGYQVSDEGRVRSFWKKKHHSTGYGTYRCKTDTPTIMQQSDDGNGYMKLMLYNRDDGSRHCKKVHRLVAEAFIEHNECDDTVDHIKSGPEGKLDNSVRNLRWIPRAENIRKAYRDGMCDDRIRRQERDIVATDLRTGEQCYFSSIAEASEMLRVDRSAISHVLIGDTRRTGDYTFEYCDGEGRLLYGDEYSKFLSWVRMGLV